MALAPAGPEAGLSLGLILLAIACVFLLALGRAYGWTLSPLLRSLSNIVHGLPQVTILGHHVPPWDALANGISGVDNYIWEGIGTGIKWTEGGLHAVLGAMTWLMQETADQVAGLAEDTWKGLQSIKKYAIPAALGVATEPLIREIAYLLGKVKDAALHPVQAVHTTVRVVAPGLAALQGRVRTLEAQVASIGAAAPTIIEQVPAAIPIPKTTTITHVIYRGIDDLRHRINKALKTLTPAGIVGLVAAATLAQLGLGWLRCKNVGKVGKKACGMSTDLLDDLLKGLIVLFSTYSLLEFGHYMQTAIKDLEPLMADFWKATPKIGFGDRQVGSATLD